MGSVTIVYTQYKGYVGYKVSPPGSKKVTLLGVGRDGPACLRQIEAAIALINEAKAITTEPPVLRALSTPEENDHGEARSEDELRQGTDGGENLLRQGHQRCQGGEAVKQSEEVGQGQR